jgi:hypothetical protein
MGFDWITQPGGPALFEVVIWRRGNAVAAAAVSAHVGDNDTDARETPV